MLYTDPPLVVDTLTFAVSEDLQPLFEYLTITGTGDLDTLAEFVAEASGVEFTSFGAAKTILDPALSGEFPARVGSLLRDFVDMTGITLEEGGELAAELADVRLPVFGSQPRGRKPIKEWGEGAGAVLMAIGLLAGTHGPALLVLTGPAGAIITLGAYGALGGIWAANRLRQRRQGLHAARTAAPAATPPSPTPSATPDPTEAARHAAVVKKQAMLRKGPPR